MDIPFVSSGASSGAHYALVRKVESETSPDVHIKNAVDSVLHDFKVNANIPLKRCREHLIMLLYCRTNASSGIVEGVSLNDALTHAITLVEAGNTIADKRIGYLFCSEVMPRNHDLQLMLVNTVRKDLESLHDPQICLALDHLISSPSEYVIPAVQTRLTDLMKHPSPNVRRRVLFAFKELSLYDANLLSVIAPDVSRRMKDPDSSVRTAALSIACRIFEVHEPARSLIHRTANELLRSTISTGIDRQKAGDSSVLKLFDTINVVGATEDNLSVISNVIRLASKQKDAALLHSILRLCPHLTALLASRELSPINYVRHLLTSRDPNDQFLFLSCLESVDPRFWAGTTPDIPSVLDQWEVEHVMRLLDSKDPLLRKMTVKLLNQIDSNIIASYYSRSLQQIPANLPPSHRAEYTCRLLEILELESGGEGEHYAREIEQLFQRVYSVNTEDKEVVLDSAVEKVLICIRQASGDWQIQCATTLLTRFLESKRVDPSMMVIISALSCEYCGKVSLSPDGLLLSLSSQLVFCPLPVQEACLLAMLRIAADCEYMPPSILNIIAKFQEQQDGRRIRLLCSKFLKLAQDRGTLVAVVRSAKGLTLPDFMRALQAYKIDPQSQPPSTAQSPSQKPEQLSPSKLRYTAYDPPTATPRLRGRSPSTSLSSRTSNVSSPNLKPRSPGLRPSLMPTGGDLTLAASSEEFEMSLMKLHVDVRESDSGSKQDLIVLDSPFISDPSNKEQLTRLQIDIEDYWNKFQSNNTRGWYEGTMQSLIERLQGAEDMRIDIVEAATQPFEGDVKLIVYPSNVLSPCAILRLRESEDDGCLWRLRGESSYCKKMKGLMAET
ncbi:ap-4 complex subunit epsilon-1 [Moniliophthora roreri MCA 2997]|uniref:Ap-4 complex subunit epsilon-1 n=2 Tax=Moniliophthora roreri TaxID=221103 RepID=V2XEW0_MONRO|nr:ap-4 complex subunit epsilon-1 [Moniliophthora roreri MCA 2997]KAI3596952.1 ap-4 complex subunit epsilon-1 [Moniliophthora roreri]